MGELKRKRNKETINQGNGRKGGGEADNEVHKLNEIMKDIKEE